MNHELYIIVAVYNRIHFTKAFLYSLNQQSLKNFCTIIIDDGSNDGTNEFIKEVYPWVKLISAEGNLWWTAATNRGVQHALNQGAKWILTLNNDTVLPPYYIANMMKWATELPNSIFGSVSVDIDSGRLVYGGERINWLFAKSDSLLKSISPEKQYGLYEVTHLPGRGLLIPANVFKSIGLFDERRFPQSGADDDFTFRAQRAGFKNFINFDSHLLIFPRESGDVKIREKKSLSNYYRHLFDIKGGGNLKRFWFLATKNCPKKYILFYLFGGFARRIFGYLIEWLKSKRIDQI